MTQPTANLLPRHSNRVIGDRIGTNDADNEFVSSAVVANADGSIFERLEYLQAGSSAGVAVATADGTANATAADVVGNKTDAAVTAVGTTKSALAYLKGMITMGTVAVADATANAFEGDVTGNKADATQQTVGTTRSVMAYVKGLMNALIGSGAATFPTAAAPANSVSLGAVLREIYDQMEKVAQTTTAATMPQATTTIFTMAGGAYKILDLLSICVTTNNGNAATQQWSIDGTLGTATTISAASASLASLVAGDFTMLVMTALSTAGVIVSTGTSVGLGAASAHIGLYANGAGVIQNIIAAAATTGTWNHFLRFRPLARGVTATAAF